MITNPKISIIVPIYNVEKFLNRCMQSLLNQTLRDIEIILVDDGSPDNCPRICDNYAQKDNRVKAIHKKNSGLGYARNTGIEIATGEYIAFVDSDDFVDLQMYEKLYNVAKTREHDVVYCGFKKETSNGKYILISECTSYTEFSGTDVFNLVLDFIASPPFTKREYKYEMSVWHSIYKRSVINKNSIRFYSEREYASEDILFQIDFLKKTTKIAFIPDIFYTYCYNGSSLTKQVSFAKYICMKRLYEMLVAKTQEQDPESFRSKRLFIGYVRAIIRTILQSQMSKKEKYKYIYDIHSDEIWNQFKSSYHPHYLPFHQRLILWSIYNNHPRITIFLCNILNLKNIKI